MGGHASARTALSYRSRVALRCLGPRLPRPARGGGLPRSGSPVSARELYDAKRIREKRAREIERDLRAQGERTRLTSLPLDAPQTPALDRLRNLRFGGPA